MWRISLSLEWLTCTRWWTVFPVRSKYSISSSHSRLTDRSDDGSLKKTTSLGSSDWQISNNVSTLFTVLTLTQTISQLFIYILPTSQSYRVKWWFLQTVSKGFQWRDFLGFKKRSSESTSKNAKNIPTRFFWHRFSCLHLLILLQQRKVPLCLVSLGQSDK